MNFDYLIFKKINDFAGKNLIFDKIMIFLAKDLIYLLFIFGIIYLFFVWKKNWKKLLSVILAIFLSRGIIIEIIRFFYYRPRPFLVHQVNNLISYDISGSFPSGHMAFIFPLVCFIISANKKIGLIFLFLVLLMGLARIYVGVHYPLDIVFGIITGLLSALIIQKIISKK